MAEDMSRDDLNNAGISPRERLERIEALLNRMDGKLDTKADTSALVSLELRVRDLEASGGARVLEMRDRVEQVDTGLQTVARKLAYATGTLATVVVLVNATTVYLINR